MRQSFLIGQMNLQFLALGVLAAASSRHTSDDGTAVAASGHNATSFFDGLKQIVPNMILQYKRDKESRDGAKAVVSWALAVRERLSQVAPLNSTTLQALLM